MYLCQIAKCICLNRIPRSHPPLPKPLEPQRPIVQPETENTSGRNQTETHCVDFDIKISKVQYQNIKYQISNIKILDIKYQKFNIKYQISKYSKTRQKLTVSIWMSMLRSANSKRRPWETEGCMEN